MPIKKVMKHNKASQDIRELEALFNILPRRERRVVLEIGVHLGYSLLNWSILFKPRLTIGIEVNSEEIKDEVVKKADAKIVVGNSCDMSTLKKVEKELDDRKIDFLFIDGGHLYYEVKKDYEMYSPLVKTGGEIVFHDIAIYNNPTVEVYKFWQEVRRKHDHAEIIKEGGNGYGVLLNYGKR